MRFINVILAVLVSLVIGAGVLEGGLRLIGLGPTQTLNEFDADLGWSKEPNLELSRSHPDASFEIDFKLNSMGLRDDEITEKKPEGVFRVLALGDSFTLGFGVNREDLFVDILENWWTAEGRRVEVINAGTEGYSTDQEVAWLETVGAKLDPDLVLLFPYENDIYWNGRDQYTNKLKPRYNADGTREVRAFPAPPEPSCGESFALTHKFVGPKRGKLAKQDFFKPAGAKHNILSEWGSVMLAEPAFMTEPLSRTRGALTALKSICADLGAKAVVVPIPSHSAIDAEYAPKFAKKHLAGLPSGSWSADKPVDTFLSLCKSVGIETVDCRTSFKERTANGDALYYDIDWHLNADGNHALAEVLHGALDGQAVFPADQQAPQGASVKPSRDKAAAAASGLPAIFLVLWLILTIMYLSTYKDEPRWQPPLKVGALLAAIFGIVLGTNKLLVILPPGIGQLALGGAILALLGFIIYKLGRRVGTILELFKAFTLRGHWYLMPLVVILLTIGSLLVVAASSPLIAPFIYTLF